MYREKKHCMYVRAVKENQRIRPPTLKLQELPDVDPKN